MASALFGDMPLPIQFFLAFLIVLGLIGAAAWAVRRFGAGALGSGTVRGRQPRLSVLEYANVDSRRRLYLVRRDNTEHLLLIGGPTDVVVEPNIVRSGAAPVREAAPPRPAVAVEPLPRAIPLPETAGNGSWPLQPEPIPMPRAPAAPPPAPLPPRVESAQDEQVAWPLQPQAESPAPPQRAQRDVLTSLADELSPRPAPPRNRPAAPPPRPPLQAEPRGAPRAAPPPPPQVSVEDTTANADQSLAEMAHRLEAALRKPNPQAEARSPAPPRRAPPPAPQAPSPEAADDLAPLPPPPPPRAARPAEPKPPRAEPKSAQAPTLYDSLEQEMASLLGRPNKP